MKRAVLIVVAVLVVVIGGGVYYVYASLDSLIQEAVEKYGSEITQAEVRLDRAELDPISGNGALRGLKVGNPEGFETPSVLELGAFSIELDMATILGDPVVIKEIVIDKPKVTYELNATGSNVAAIQKNADDYMAKHGLGQEGGGPKLVIENLYIRNGTVRVSAGILQGKTLSASLPDIHLTDIGKETGGASPAEVAERIIKSLSGAATAAVAGLGIGATLDSLKQHLGGLTGGALGDLTKGVGKSLGEVTKDIGQSLGEMTKGLGQSLGDVTKGVTESTEGAGTGLGTSVGKVGKKLKGLFGN